MICKLYITNPDIIFEIVYKEFLLFHIQSKTNPDITYNVSLSCHYCDYPTVIPTCKHIIGLQFILKKYLSTDFKLFEFVDSQVPSQEPVIITFNLEDSPILEESGPRPIAIHTPFEEERKLQLLQLQATISEVWQTLESSLVHVSGEEWKHKIELSNRFIESLKEPFIFDEPVMMDLPTKGFISTIQTNVKHTKMGFGSSARSIEKKYGNIYDSSKGGSIEERPPLKRQGHTLAFTSKSKRAFFPRVSKIFCQVCMTKYGRIR